ncbi:MAG: EamA family transporter RarD [Spirochaetaceae bacterium]|jgi:chloramphenicol-sensitive protein RarD|nr:EamA family transporter RarD [Spirochaetaceae bacterium]
MNRPASLTKGILYAFTANVIWGIVPIYWRLFPGISPLRILAFRILFSFLVVGIFLLARKDTAWIGIFKNAKKGGPVFLSALLISLNWGFYIWAVNSNHIIESSLGYYIQPVVYILLGLFFFRERLPPLQWTAFGFAATGVLLLTFFSGTFPWIALTLALTFSAYGLFKKSLTIDPLSALGAETFIVSPLAIVLLFLPIQGTIGESGLSPLVLLGLLPSGILTSLPLYCFAQGTKLLPLSAVGFMQFVSPTLLFLVGVFIFPEPFPVKNLMAFGFIWVSVILYSLSLFMPRERRRIEEPVSG